MIFWIILALTVIGFILWWLDYWHFETEILSAICGVLSVVGSIAVVIMTLTILADATFGLEGKVAAYEKQYEALVYKVETEAIRDEFGIVNKEYIDEVQEWNVDLAKKKEYQRDFWIGIFYPNIYDDFEFIDLNKIKMKN